MKLFNKQLFPSCCHSVNLTSNCSPLRKHIRLSFVRCMLDANLIVHAFPERVREMVEGMLLTRIESSVLTKMIAISRKFWLFFSCTTVCLLFIPTVPIIPGDISFKFSRLLFPLRLALVVSINKAHGSSSKMQVLKLRLTVFLMDIYM